MQREKGWQMYTDIQSLKELGLNKSQIARKLGISRPTLNKYYDMDADEYNKKGDIKEYTDIFKRQ